MVNLHDYVKYDQEEEACVLGLPVMPLRSPEGFEGEECAKDHPNGLSAKIVAVDSGHDDDMPADKLEIYFSNNYGEDNFYNADTPREAARQHNGVFDRRGLLEVKDGEENNQVEDDEILSHSLVQSLEGRTLLAAFHEESRRRLCYDPGNCSAPNKVYGDQCSGEECCSGLWCTNACRSGSSFFSCCHLDDGQDCYPNPNAYPNAECSENSFCSAAAGYTCQSMAASVDGYRCANDWDCNSGYCDKVKQECSSACSSDQSQRGPDCSCTQTPGETYTQCGMYESAIQLYCQKVPYSGTDQAFFGDPITDFYERCTASAVGDLFVTSCSIVTDPSLGPSRPCSLSSQICDTITWHSCDKYHQLTCSGKCVFY